MVQPKIKGKFLLKGFEILLLKRTGERQTLTLFIVTLNRVRYFGLNGMRLLSKRSEKCTLLNLSSHYRVHFMANWLCQFVQMGHVKQLTKPIF